MGWEHLTRLTKNATQMRDRQIMAYFFLPMAIFYNIAICKANCPGAACQAGCSSSRMVSRTVSASDQPLTNSPRASFIMV